MTTNRTVATISALGLAVTVAACGDDKPQMSTAKQPSQASPASPPMSPPVSTPQPTPSPPPAAGGTDPAMTAKDSAATDPKGDLTKEEESKRMPEAGQANNHSSPALDPGKK